MKAFAYLLVSLLLAFFYLSNGNPLPNRMGGFYVLLADNTVPGYTSNDNWQPALLPYQQKGTNALFFTFIDPTNMKVPPAFSNLAKTRGTNAEGAVPSGTTIIFSVGGYSYSIHPNPWPFLASKAAASSMALEVSTWPEKYGCDGIDLDIETGAGDAAGAGDNLVTFIKTLKSRAPKMIVTQPVFGYPQVKAEIEVVNESWNVDNTTTNGLADTVGIMVYTGTQSLNYVKNYAEGAHQWQGFPIKVDVPYHSVVTGLGGSATSSDIMSMSSSVKGMNLGGWMVWYASVLNKATGKMAFRYGENDDATGKSTEQTWAQALQAMQ